MGSATTSTEQIQIHRTYPRNDPNDTGLHQHSEVDKSLSRNTGSMPNCRRVIPRETSRDYINTSLPRQLKNMDGSYAHLDKNVKVVRNVSGHEYLNLPQYP